MILKFEDDIYTTGPRHEYINSDKIFRIRLTRKRIRIYTHTGAFSYIFVGRTEHNMNELKKLDKEIGDNGKQTNK